MIFKKLQKQTMMLKAQDKNFLTVINDLTKATVTYIENLCKITPLKGPIINTYYGTSGKLYPLDEELCNIIYKKITYLPEVITKEILNKHSKYSYNKLDKIIYDLLFQHYIKHLEIIKEINIDISLGKAEDVLFFVCLSPPD